MLSPAQILDRLGHSLDLAGGARDLPERQRTLRAAIAWSHDLLSEPERRLFRRLAVFAGGWTADAAQLVTDPAGDLGMDLVDGLESLADKSLIRVEPAVAGEAQRGPQADEISLQPPSPPARVRPRTTGRKRRGGRDRGTPAAVTRRGRRAGRPLDPGTRGRSQPASARSRGIATSARRSTGRWPATSPRSACGSLAATWRWYPAAGPAARRPRRCWPSSCAWTGARMSRCGSPGSPLMAAWPTGWMTSVAPATPTRNGSSWPAARATRARSPTPHYDLGFLSMVAQDGPRPAGARAARARALPEGGPRPTA